MYKSNLETGFLMKSNMGLLPAGEQTENENFTQKKFKKITKSFCANIKLIYLCNANGGHSSAG
ncbi:hypothetical protein [Gynurincola endophyticus]|uniref:hypothetical protein n=1 Tax=Gynurincola endophyticus TaxID=2479004 RepID=UPI000F8E1C4E|nr:hypothetical protein [Gynurincola endophyticus]